MPLLDKVLIYKTRGSVTLSYVGDDFSQVFCDGHLLWASHNKLNQKQKRNLRSIFFKSVTPHVPGGRHGHLSRNFLLMQPRTTTSRTYFMTFIFVQNLSKIVLVCQILPRAPKIDKKGQKYKYLIFELKFHQNKELKIKVAKKCINSQCSKDTQKT